MKYYFKLFKYLNDQNPYFNFSVLFGFNEGIFKFDDYHISENQFIDRLSQLDIQWISDNVTDKDKLAEHEDDLHRFYRHLTNGFKTIFNEVILKRVVERLEPHVAVNLQKDSVKKSRAMKLGPTAKLNMK